MWLSESKYTTHFHLYVCPSSFPLEVGVVVLRQRLTRVASQRRGVSGRARNSQRLARPAGPIGLANSTRRVVGKRRAGLVAKSEAANLGPTHVKPDERGHTLREKR